MFSPASKNSLLITILLSFLVNSLYASDEQNNMFQRRKTSKSFSRSKEKKKRIRHRSYSYKDRKNLIQQEAIEGKKYLAPLDYKIEKHILSINFKPSNLYQSQLRSEQFIFIDDLKKRGGKKGVLGIRVPHYDNFLRRYNVYEVSDSRVLFNRVCLSYPQSSHLQEDFTHLLYKKEILPLEDSKQNLINYLINHGLGPNIVLSHINSTKCYSIEVRQGGLSGRSFGLAIPITEEFAFCIVSLHGDGVTAVPLEEAISFTYFFSEMKNLPSFGKMIEISLQVLSADELERFLESDIDHYSSYDCCSSLCEKISSFFGCAQKDKQE